MELWILVILNLLCILAALHYRYEKFNVVKLGAMSVTLFWALYSVISGIWFLVDKFSFGAVLGSQLVLMLAVVGGLFRKCGRKPIKLEFSVSRDMIVLLLIFVAVLLTGSKFELFSTGQDQGLYQAEALELYMGNYEVEHDFEEYQILEKDEDKAVYRKMLDEVWVGYYPLKDSAYSVYTENAESKSDVSGMYHGVQTFPAMLALMGRLFGMRNMVQVQTLFYVCSIVLLYYTMCEMKVHKGSRIFLTAVFMLSPLVLWISKASYTEMFLTMAICFYLYLLFEENDKKLMLSIPLIAFAFVHVSFLILWPVFWIVNSLLYIYRKNKQYMYVNILSAIGLFVGYQMMSQIAPQYFYLNCARLYYKDIVTHENLMIWILGVCLLSCIVSLGMLRMNMEYVKKFVVKIQGNKWLIPAVLSFAIIFWVYYGAKLGYFMEAESAARPDLCQYYGQGLVAYTHLAIYACAMATGFVILPCVIGSLFVKSRTILQNVNYFMLTLLFLYIVILQSVFLRVDIPYYYYYSRYLVYYVPVICLMAAVCFEGWKKRALVPVAAITLCAMFYFDVAILQEKDDTVWEWETLEDLAAVIEENSAVILRGTELQRMVGPQLRTVAETAVFPVFEDLDGEITLLYENYDHVYILSEEMLNVEQVNEHALEIAYRDQYQYSKAANFVLGVYPTEIIPVEKELVLYRFAYEKYALGSDIWFATEARNCEKYVMTGLSANEETFSWTDGDKLSMQLWIDTALANDTVKASFEVLHVYNTEQKVQVLVNGSEVYSTTISNGNNLEFEFEVPHDGMVDIDLLFPDAVSPNEISGSGDTRELALGLVKAVFSQKGA